MEVVKQKRRGAQTLALVSSLPAQRYERELRTLQRFLKTHVPPNQRKAFLNTVKAELNYALKDARTYVQRDACVKAILSENVLYLLLKQPEVLHTVKRVVSTSDYRFFLKYVKNSDKQWLEHTAHHVKDVFMRLKNETIDLIPLLLNKRQAQVFYHNGFQPLINAYTTLKPYFHEDTPLLLDVVSHYPFLITYINDPTTLDAYATVYADYYAYLRGHQIDELHDDPQARRAFLKSLTDKQLAALVCSPPFLFYTSSNTLLLEELKARTTNVMAFLNKQHINTDTAILHFVTRAMRLGYVNKTFFTDEEIKNVIIPAAVKTLMRSKSVREVFLAVNALQQLQQQGFATHITERIKHLTPNTVMNALAVEALQQQDEQRVFNARQFADNGILHVVEVFKRGDADNYYHNLIKTLKKRGYRQIGHTFVKGKVVFEVVNVNIEKGQTFVEQVLKKRKNVVLVFRGHSYNLKRVIPPELFERKRGGRVLLIAGSCGSGVEMPAYALHAKHTQLWFIGYLTVGRGWVTNNLVDKVVRLFNSNKTVLFKELERGVGAKDTVFIHNNKAFVFLTKLLEHKVVDEETVKNEVKW